MDRDAPHMEEARPVRPEELGQVLALVNKVFRTGVDQDMSTDYPLVFAPGNLDNLRVVSEGGSIFSHAAMARRELREHGCALPVSMICAVATDPERRRRGAASRIMEDTVEAMAARGDAFGLLWTGPARDFYRRLGWEVVGSNGWAYQVEPQLAGRFEQPLPVRPFQAGTDLERIIEIHEAQPRRLTRTEAEYRTLLGLPKSEVWVAEEKGRVEGYLVVARAYNKSGVVEWGGTPEALSSLLARALPEPAGERMQVFVPLPDNPMTELLTGRGCRTRIPMETADGCGLKMVRILSLGNLLRQLSTCLKNRLTGGSGQVSLWVRETGERVDLRWDGGDLEVVGGRASGPQEGAQELSLRQAARLVFGPEKPSQILDPSQEDAQDLDRAFPFVFHIWMLDYV
ncbi:MAG: GNAT family N-acetyltransferase [Acidobacteria bacterium]|nr:GNAT family N-acetyltransferase [Acidobacteriota bacterium]